MKNQFIISVLTCTLVLTSCLDNEENNLSLESPNLKEVNLSVNQNDQSSIIFKLKEIGKEILNKSDSKLKATIYQHVEQQFDGDYNVLIETLVLESQSRNNGLNHTSQILSFFNQKKLYPQVFIPFFEELKEEGILGKKKPILVINENQESIREYPGYTIDEIGNLIKLDFMIDEKFASKNEIWVIGLNERIGHESYISIDNKKIDEEYLRVQSGWYNGALQIKSFMIPDLGAIESWINGKIELEVRAYSHLIGNIKYYNYGQIKRKYLKNQKWRNAFTPICNWDDTIGENIIVHWTEIDGGASTTTISLPFPSFDGIPATTFSFNISEDDDDLGYNLIQKSHDLATMVYDTGLIEWKMITVY